MAVIRWIVVLSLALALLAVIMFGLQPPSLEHVRQIFEHGPPPNRPPKLV